MQMKRTLIRYKTRPETTEQNQRLIEDVFAELQAKSPEGIRYMALKLTDGSFLHFVETGDGDSPLPVMEAFRRFQSGIRERCIEPPQPSEAIIVGNFRMLGER
jgi:radical SAM superfamily enzyme with C-terminal helix-hairpin-helix motif